MRCGFLVALLAVSSILHGADLSPWFGTVLEIEAHADGEIEAYRSVNADNHSQHQPACNLFFSAGAGTTYDDIAGELEVVSSDTRYRDFGMDSICLTGRYRWLNDIIGDSISLVSGLSISQVFKPGLRNLSSFHHGGIECETHLSLGKEISCEQLWTRRYWALAAVGIADLGYPWVRGNINWEWNFCDMHRTGIFVESLWGLGPHKLDLDFPFHGYGSIHHQSVDAGFWCSCLLRGGETISLQYAYRLFSRNCPKGSNQLIVNLYYPFGL